MTSILDRLTGAADRAETADLREQVQAERDTVELLERRLTESVTQLELAMEDVGWQRLIATGDQEFSRDGLRRITAACRLFGLGNALIKRGLVLRGAYVWGQGVEVSARANGKGHAGEQDVNAVIAQFVDDPGNRRVLFGADAQLRVERSLGTDGNLFLSLWTMPLTGRVQVRTLPWDEIDDVICNPQDGSEPWFYYRRWTATSVNPSTGRTETTQMQAFYPALGYRPRSRPKRLGDVEVRWDAPVRHVKINDLDGWKFGVPDAYAAIAWARAYKEFLEDWARLVKSLSRYAWRTTAKGAAQATAIRARVAAAPARPGEGSTAGATVVTSPDAPLEAIPKSGATIDSQSGKPLAAMVAAALGVPVTMLLADPGTTGARATAETLDQPTELEMEGRRSLHSDVMRDLCQYAILEAVRAPRGPLKGVLGRDEYERETVTLAADTDPTIDVAWPDLKDLDPAGKVAAITAGAATGTIPPAIILRLLLTALGERNVDDLVDAMTDEEGNFLWPGAPPIAGSQAAGLARTGGDPATAGNGSMTPDNPDNPDGGTGDGSQP